MKDTHHIMPLSAAAGGATGAVSRRGFLEKSTCTAGAAALAGALAGCATRPAKLGTVPKAEALYQDQPKGLAHCSICKHFYSPDICEVVAGPVSRQGWCKFYTLL